MSLRAMPRLLPLLGLAATGALFGGSAVAQGLTPAQFVAACSVPGQPVILREPTKFQTAFSGTTFSVPGGCNVTLAPGASLELDTITLRFGGPLVVVGGGSSKVTLDKATLSAPAVSISFIGSEGQFEMNEARLDATAGDLRLVFGEKGQFKMVNSGRWYQPRLTAQGQLSIAAGPLFSGTIVQSGLQGARGIGMAFNGTESGMKIERSDLLVSSGAPNGGAYTAGPFTVTSPAAKVAFEMIDVNLMEASQAVQIALNGAESKLGLVSLRSQTSSQRIALGALGSKGEVKVENVLMYGVPEVIIQTGAEGSTTVTNSPGSITSAQRITVRAGAGGSCSATPASSFNAPVVSLCR